MSDIQVGENWMCLKYITEKLTPKRCLTKVR